MSIEIPTINIVIVLCVCLISETHILHSAAFNDVHNGNNGRAQLNGNTQRLPLTPWPQGQGNYRGLSNMFYLPTRINPGHEFEVTGEIQNKNHNLSISLETQNDTEVPFKFIADFSTNKMEIQITENGITTIVKDDENLSAYFDNANFSMGFSLLESNDGNITLNFVVSGSPMADVTLKHSLHDITHINIDGDVTIHKLTFTYVKPT